MTSSTQLLFHVLFGVGVFVGQLKFLKKQPNSLRACWTDLELRLRCRLRFEVLKSEVQGVDFGLKF